MNVFDFLKGAKPQETPASEIPAALTLKVVAVEGQTRQKFVGVLDDAKTVQVNLYLPAGVKFPKEGITLEVGGDGFNVEASVARTKRGSVKLAWGAPTDSEEFFAAVFLPPKANVESITCKV